LCEEAASFIFFLKKIKIAKIARPKAARRNDKAAGSRPKETICSHSLTTTIHFVVTFPSFYEISKKVYLSQLNQNPKPKPKTKTKPKKNGNQTILKEN
jgi:hypothetical protein